MAAPVIKGLATIQWGTPNAVGGAFSNSSVLVSLKVTPKNGMPIEIEDGNGFGISLVYLADGFDAAAEALYDTAKSWPNSAATVTINIPSVTGNGAVAAFNCSVASDPEIDLARKRETMISYKLIYRPQIN